MIKRKGLKLKPRESRHERKFREYAESRGCIVRKFKAKKNDPDRIVMCPGGRVMFIEFKRDVLAEIRDSQIMRIFEFAALGFECALCFSYEHACEILDRFLDETHTV